MPFWPHKTLLILWTKAFKMSINKKLLTPLTTPVLTFSNRVVMAPMNRRRAIKGIPGQAAITYYGQRAGAGLLITDNTAIAPNAIGYMDTPGIYTTAQQQAWKKVVDEVHSKQGKIFIQLVHAGRIGHNLNNEDGSPLVAPSALQAAGSVRTPGEQYLPNSLPEALTTEGVQAIIQAHIQAAITAINIGFDGVEIHGAHGYLSDQFLNPHTNQRTDQYGGSIPNRTRFLIEIIQGVTAAIGAHRTGIRLSPFATLNDLAPYAQEEEIATHHYLASALQELNILYIHLSDQSAGGCPPIPHDFIRGLRHHFRNQIILAGGYTDTTAEVALQSGLADLVAFGRPFIANPDLVERFRNNAPLTTGDKETFYKGGEDGYIDYPTLYPSTTVASLS
jgi:N-ethylmaleimide reductase